MKNTNAFLKKVRTILRENKTARQKNLLCHLNRVILG